MSEIDHKYRQIVISMDKGMGQMVFSILLDHVGKKKSILGSKLVYKLKQFFPDDNSTDLQRKMRLAIADLRKQGYLIASAPGKLGGYWLPANRKEFDEFIRHEFIKKIEDMAITKNILVTAADKQLGLVYQERFI